MKSVAGLVFKALPVALGALIADPATAQVNHGADVPPSIAATTAQILPKFQRSKDAGDHQAECLLLMLYLSGQAVPREKDNLDSRRRNCGYAPYASPGHPPPPGLSVPPPKDPVH